MIILVASVTTGSAISELQASSYKPQGERPLPYLPEWGDRGALHPRQPRQNLVRQQFRALDRDPRRPQIENEIPHPDRQIRFQPFQRVLRRADQAEPARVLAEE